MYVASLQYISSEIKSMQLEGKLAIMLADLILREPVVRVDNDSKILYPIFVTPKLEFQ